ncbi:MAG: hypothetical protein ABT940_12330, partial [Alphaproteobacteria bacterium]
VIMSTIFARVVDNKVLEIVAIPEGSSLFDCFHPQHASQCVPAPEGCQQGWVAYQGTLVDPRSVGYLAAQALAASDTTMMRIGEAVSLGLTTWETADVVAWMTWRRSLRGLLDDHTVQDPPVRPAFPAGT